MTIAVTGGTGFVGHAFLDLAGDAQLRTRSLARSPQGGRMGNVWVRGGLEDRAALAELVGPAEAVVHIAGVTSSHDDTDFETGNVIGTLNLVAAAKAAGVKRFIFVSSLAAREPELSLYGGSKARAEKIVQASGLDWTIVRPPAVYGPRDRDMFELFRMARWGVVPAPKRGRASLIHVYDLARLLMALAQNGHETIHRVIEPDDGVPGGWDHQELALAIGAAMGRRVVVLGQSARSLRWAARLDRMMKGDKAKLTPDRASYLAHPDWVVSPEHRVPDHIWRPRIETRDGLKATAKWYRDEDWL
ncbi:MAG TPA: NAD(P)-dependent oxidoreductase [Novosphingobium sp.]|nr:NAD(P)-dependent oxidoreductase [Novosphingobium sp.]HMP56773.1 NAD(P)-dependent oxidoreductase [Novosphingobium sp.]